MDQELTYGVPYLLMTRSLASDPSKDAQMCLRTFDARATVNAAVLRPASYKRSHVSIFRIKVEYQSRRLGVFSRPPFASLPTGP